MAVEYDAPDFGTFYTIDTERLLFGRSLFAKHRLLLLFPEDTLPNAVSTVRNVPGVQTAYTVPCYEFGERPANFLTIMAQLTDDRRFIGNGAERHLDDVTDALTGYDRETVLAEGEAEVITIRSFEHMFMRGNAPWRHRHRNRGWLSAAG